MTRNLTRTTQDARVSELLGLGEEIDSSAALNTQVADGLPATSMDSILQTIDAQATIKIIPERALRQAKLKNTPLSPAKSQILYDFARAYVVADRIYDGNSALIMRFLEKPHNALDGAAPLAIAISSPAGADAVIDLLEQ
ncbi:putative toxin-antitoxin system antitoxin component (TIGR02293 family) [Sulfitobacter undariae]|uniref:Putative toxin-antitoxin system antitoxin component (TIGR02293 family) n=1 Tax=Sulfitobacter undariae TaxID=1563671 RepID=A0A7W6E944_9RHOB|nr:antitoxin Xre/MbcA/ParS toxin-binding domain-containing protein [Sulfitobacter undariae]MBB3995711.1 putative toxin-antitoxin system antitoxin component (TIGR02293 family) [Sulfitobacter undariae]